MMQGAAAGLLLRHCRVAAERRASTSPLRAPRSAEVGASSARARRRALRRRCVHRVPARAAAPSEVLLWERFWLERSKDLDRELHAIVKGCRNSLSFGLNVWNRNHLNPIRKAQWSWAEQVAYADWVKPIVYQHQAGLVFAGEMDHFARTLLADYAGRGVRAGDVRGSSACAGAWRESWRRGWIQTATSAGNARRGARRRRTHPGLHGHRRRRPRQRADQAACTPEIVHRSVHAAYRAGASGVVFAPSYAG
jgi:hypothetical protein